MAAVRSVTIYPDSPPNNPFCLDIPMPMPPMKIASAGTTKSTGTSHPPAAAKTNPPSRNAVRFIYPDSPSPEPVESSVDEGMFSTVTSKVPLTTAGPGAQS